MNRLVIMVFEELFIHSNDWEFIQEGAYLLWLNIYDSWVSPGQNKKSKFPNLKRSSIFVNFLMQSPFELTSKLAQLIRQHL